MRICSSHYNISKLEKSRNLELINSLWSMNKGLKKYETFQSKKKNNRRISAKRICLFIVHLSEFLFLNWIYFKISYMHCIECMFLQINEEKERYAIPQEWLSTIWRKMCSIGLSGWTSWVWVIPGLPSEFQDSKGYRHS